ncbi:DgyrCDS1819 [Dimorphilus gyrociliatus]|uniref:DgyrCDS1819 n=1 Tax=Dimorphilus gyrociliatus TaxID=2664684 RepID=A0A7I8VDK8_9ANNE|nr:DgyrCDS1819 [Dimorphilus gyrociliatus]
MQCCVISVIFCVRKLSIVQFTPHSLDISVEMALNQFLLLLWKNWLLQSRKIVLTLFQIGLPTVFALILVLIRPRVTLDIYPEDTSFYQIPSTVFILPFQYRALSCCLKDKIHLAYSPENDITTRIMNRFKETHWSGEEFIDVIPFKNESMLEAYFRNIQADNSPPGERFNCSFYPIIPPEIEQICDLWSNQSIPIKMGGIVFKNVVDEIPKQVEYKIRFPAKHLIIRQNRGDFFSATDWLTTFIFPRFRLAGPRSRYNIYGGAPNYIRTGFSGVQIALDKAIALEKTSNTDNLPIAKFRRMSYPPHIRDFFIQVIQRQLPFIIMLSLIITAANVVQDLVLEKEKRLRESMKLMGLKTWVHWLSWFVKYLSFILISIAIMTILYCVKFSSKGAIIRFADPSLIFVFLLLYSIATIMFCFAVSCAFSKASSGAAAGAVLFLASYVPYFFFQNQYETLSNGVKFGTSIFHNVAMAFGCMQIALFEGTGVGLKWNNFHKPYSVDDSFTMLHVFVMLIADSIFYGLITWYLDNVVPGEYGIPRPLYFPFTKSYWCGKKVRHMDVEEIDTADLDSESFEKLPVGAISGICLRNLRKEFGSGPSKKIAVQGTTIDMLEGQITALLGHNGAGKTTTMSMLTGFLQPSSGTAYINGLDIRTDLEEVRKTLGLCPQHDILFDNLTVKEHLEFFAKLKGCEAKDVKSEVDRMIEVLKLHDKRNYKAGGLSGGQKRKLSVGIALIGGSKIVILDEPTSGMDPEARRQTWDILQSEREGRTMILSTHFMDEADLLGDRIAIMAHGKVQCYGTSLFLKKKYGVGYHMVIVKSKNCDVNILTEVVCKHVPEAAIESNISSELSYVLPQESSSAFEGLFSELEADKIKLGISSFGASVTTMEEVFLKVGESVDSTLEEKMISQAPDTKNGLTYHNYENPVFEKDQDLELKGPIAGGKKIDFNEGSKSPQLPWSISKKNSGGKLVLQQVRTMLWKRFIHSLRNKLVSVTQLAVPLFFTIIPCIVLRTLPGPREGPALNLSLSMYDSPITTVYSNYSANNQIMPRLLENFKNYANEYGSIREPGSEKYNGSNRYIVEQAKNSLSLYKNNYQVAIDGRQTYFELLFNGESYHSVGTAFSVLGNAVQRMLISPEHGVKATNHPLPRDTNEQVEDELRSSAALGMIIAFNVMFGMAFLVGTFAIFLIKERAVKSKHLQFVSGVNSFSFWSATFFYDLINYAIPSILLIPVFVAFNIKALVAGTNLAWLFLIDMLYGWAILPFIYFTSSIFTVPSSGYVWLTVLNIFTGTLAVLAVLILRIPDLNTGTIADVLEWVFHIILPNFNFGRALQNLYINADNRRICDRPEIESFCNSMIEIMNSTNPCCFQTERCGNFCAHWTKNPADWSSPGIGKSLIFLSIQGLLFTMLVFIIDSGTARRAVSAFVSSSRAMMASQFDDDSMIDEDVQEEKLRIKSTPMDTLAKTDTIVLSDVVKFYGNFRAVEGLNVGIPGGECFGLLGVNGAGKTTTFKMLTGDESLSGGKAFIETYNVASEIKQVQQRVGYCPQFDALIDQMTVKETLEMYARLRGVREEELKQVVQSLIQGLLLEEYTDKQAGQLSGGNKRKLSTAMALVGDPPVILLDEPTTGMDPVARRLLWQTLNKVRDAGKTLVLTSHSMEECEALCTRLAIMVNGQFKCLGTTQHLKTRFGEGYTLVAKLSGSTEEEVAERMQEMQNFVESSFEGATLKDKHHGLVYYQLKSRGVSWASLFGTIEKNRERLHIDDYSVSQTTLEQVFINFARTQKPPTIDKSNIGVQCTRCCSYILCCRCCCKDDA